MRIGSRLQDASHDYGHGKFETLVTFFVALALVAAAVGIIVSGDVKFAGWLQGDTLTAPGAIALWAALISIAVKEALYRYTVVKGKTLDSQVVGAMLVKVAWDLLKGSTGDGDLSLSEAHEIVSQMERKLKDCFGPDTLVTIHMEPTK